MGGTKRRREAHSLTRRAERGFPTGGPAGALVGLYRNGNEVHPAVSTRGTSPDRRAHSTKSMPPTLTHPLTWHLPPDTSGLRVRLSGCYRVRPRCSQSTRRFDCREFLLQLCVLI